ncbi:hypothetical protein LTR97_005032 [Elasticomyces elasticus]|uniref:RING-type E3 ubiquitin transferase n=1 Tax=Elasticomyces elasticus TaxID=574655 RepID=A0AAN8A2M4_9PEZI|nr:hypothetical protein LTR97_005032 [Elasticomyces elasticus]
MDSTNQQPQQRDMVFCHQCEDEWYRDQHGLQCPQCHSDFTEIIEADHDPREDDQHIPADAPDHRTPQQHGEYYGAGAPDPDEDDIDHIHWNETAPGTFRGNVNRTISIDPTQPVQPQLQAQLQNLQRLQGPRDEDGVGGNLISSLIGTVSNMLGGMAGQQGIQQGGQQGGQQGQQVSQQQPGQGAEQRPQSPDAGQGRSTSVPGRPGSTVRTFHGPNFHMTMMTSSNSNLYPRNANAPQAFQQQPQNIDQMMAQMFANVVPFPGGQGGMNFGGGPPGMHGLHDPQPGTFDPFANIFRMLGGNGQLGDAVYTQEAMDRIMTELMERNAAGNAPGPATEAAIRALPTREINATDLGDGGKAECTICMDEVNIGGSVSVLPCTHWFHGDCIKAWLSEHDTCPHCRQGIMPKDDTNRARQPNEAPANDTHAPEYHGPRDVPGGFPGLDRRESDSTFGDRPSMHRRSSSTPGRPGSSRQGSTGGGSATTPALAMLEMADHAAGVVDPVEVVPKRYRFTKITTMLT